MIEDPSIVSIVIIVAIGAIGRVVTRLWDFAMKTNVGRTVGCMVIVRVANTAGRNGGRGIEGRIIENVR